jgi:hypothetical protein
MATIPTYDGPQVERQAFRPVYQQDVDVSSGARAVAQGLGQVAQVAQQIGERRAETEANRVDEEVTAGWMAWNAENRPKFQGEKAADYAGAAEQWWAKAAEQYSGKVSPMASARIGQELGRKRTRALAGAVEYSQAELERHADSQAEATAQRAIEFGVDTGDYAGAAERIRSINAQKAARKGMSPEMLEQENQRLVGAMHLSAIEKLADTDAAAATAYFNDDRVKREMPASAQNRVEKVLKTEGDNQFATAFAAKLADKPLAEQLAQAGTIDDPERREKALTQVRNNYALVKQARNEQEEAAADRAWQAVAQGKRPAASDLASMGGRQVVQLQDHLQMKARQAVADAEGRAKPVKTNPADMAKLLDEARDNPEAFAKRRLEPLAGVLAQGDMEQIASMQRSLRKPETAKEVATTQQLLGGYTSGMKPEKRGTLEIAAYAALDKAQAARGRELSYQEKTQVIDGLLLEGTVEKNWAPDATRKVYEVKPEERAKFTPKAVPPADRQLIIEAARAQGKPVPTEQEIMARFLKRYRAQ